MPLELVGSEARVCALRHAGSQQKKRAYQIHVTVLCLVPATRRSTQGGGSRDTKSQVSCSTYTTEPIYRLTYICTVITVVYSGNLLDFALNFVKVSLYTASANLIVTTTSSQRTQGYSPFKTHLLERDPMGAIHNS